MKFDIISICFIVIFVVSVLIGIKRGLFKTITSFIKGTLSFILAVFLCKYVAKLLMSCQVGITLENKFLEILNSKGEFFMTTINESNKAEVINRALQDLKLPQFLTNFLVDIVPITAENTVAEALAPTISYYILVAISFLVLLIAFRLLAIILSKVLAIMEQIPFVGLLNKISGGILNGFIGVLLIGLICYAITFIVCLDNQVSLFFIEQMSLCDEQVTTISKYMYENNLLLKIIAYLGL